MLKIFWMMVLLTVLLSPEMTTLSFTSPLMEMLLFSEEGVERFLVGMGVDVRYLFASFSSPAIITNPLEEHQWQDVALPVRAVNGRAAQNVCGFPEMAFEGGESCGCHIGFGGEGIP